MKRAKYFPQRRGTSSPRIAIASPFDVWCTGIEVLLEQAGWTLAGRWRNCREAVAAASLADTDVLIIARILVDRPVDALLFRPLHEHYTGKLIVVVEPGDKFSFQDFVAFDAEGLILSTADLGEVIACIACIDRGRRWVDPGIRGLLGQVQRPAPDLSHLSGREQQVARRAALGLSNKQIARELGVSDGTVKMHMHHILVKLNLSSRFNLGQLDGLRGEEAPAAEFEQCLIEVQI